MIVSIPVTAEDLRDGKKNDCQFCPVARAISRTLALLGLFDGPLYVSYSCIEIGRSGRRIPIEADMRSYIWEIDQGKDVEPRSFAIEYPEAIWRIR